MSKQSKSALLTLVAFFVIGFAITADAKPAKLQTLLSSPIIGNSAWCLVYNTTDVGIDVHLVMFDNGSEFVNVTYFAPAKSFIRTGDPLGSGASACRVSWEGQPEDLRATICAELYIDGDWNKLTQTCLELR